MLTGGNLPSFSAPSKAHSSQLLLPHSHPRRLSESSCTETTCSFSTVCITLPQKRDKVNRNSSCLIRFLQKSLTISCQLFYTTPALCRAGLGSRLGRCWALPTGEQHPRQQPRPSPSAPATKPAETLGFCRFSFCTCRMGMGSALVQTPGFLTQLYPFSTVPIPSSTQNAPGFALFGPNRVRFSLFCCFLAAKFSPWFLCNLPHSVYKLKPSVIPCRREVSFLT